MGYNARNDEIRDNITRMRREWEAQRARWQPSAASTLTPKPANDGVVFWRIEAGRTGIQGRQRRAVPKGWRGPTGAKFFGHKIFDQNLVGAQCIRESRSRILRRWTFSLNVLAKRKRGECPKHPR